MDAVQKILISTHPPREGRDDVAPVKRGKWIISTHPPREGRDTGSDVQGFGLNRFQPTRPVRGGTARRC